MTEHKLDGKRVVVRRAYSGNKAAWHVIGTAVADGDCSTHGCKAIERGNYSHYSVDSENDNNFSKIVGLTFHARELLPCPPNQDKDQC
ncbi:MAG: hypothetical protein IIB28_05915 [Chloroflexi bacterium]|nr:hypothetical protein [Chloroflexota bacterium]